MKSAIEDMEGRVEGEAVEGREGGEEWRDGERC